MVCMAGRRKSSLVRQLQRAAEAVRSRAQKQIRDAQAQALLVCPMLGDLVSRNQQQKCGPRKGRASAHESSLEDDP